MSNNIRVIDLKLARTGRVVELSKGGAYLVKWHSSQYEYLTKKMREEKLFDKLRFECKSTSLKLIK